MEEARVLQETRPEALPMNESEKKEETHDEMLSRHRKEITELQKKDTEMKKSAGRGSKAEQKAKKKQVEEEISLLSGKLRERRAEELSLHLKMAETQPLQASPLEARAMNESEKKEATRDEMLSRHRKNKKQVEGEISQLSSAKLKEKQAEELCFHLKLAETQVLQDDPLEVQAMNDSEKKEVIHDEMLSSRKEQLMEETRVLVETKSKALPVNESEKKEETHDEMLSFQGTGVVVVHGKQKQYIQARSSNSLSTKKMGMCFGKPRPMRRRSYPLGHEMPTRNQMLVMRVENLFDDESQSLVQEAIVRAAGPAYVSLIVDMPMRRITLIGDPSLSAVDVSIAVRAAVGGLTDMEYFGDAY